MSTPITRRGLRRIATLAAFALVATLLPATTAMAGTVTINFDNLAAGTVVDNEYAAQGVTFSAPQGALGATGLPVVVSGAQAHTAPNLIQSTCFGCEFVPRTIRADLSTTATTVTARVGTGAGCASSTVSLRAYTAGGAVISTQAAAVTSSSTQQVSVADPTNSAIAFIRFFDNQQGCEIRVDTLAVTTPETGPQPDFSLSVADNYLRVAPEVPATTTLTITRLNGSTGPIDFSATGLPPGVSATFSPDPASGSSTTLTLATTSVPRTFEFTVWAHPSAGAGGSPRTVIMQGEVQTSATVRGPTTMTTQQCGGGTSAPFTLTRFPGYTGAVQLTTNLSVGDDFDTLFAPSTSPAGTTDFTRHTLTVVPTPEARATTYFAEVDGNTTGDNGSVQPQPVTLTVVPPAITSVTPTRLTPGGTATIRGSGFCAGTSFRFGNDLATVTPPPSAYNADRTSVTLTVPRLATDGELTATAGEAVATLDPYDVRDPRQDNGFRFDNYVSEGVNQQILIDTYGRDEVNFKIDLCWPFGCTITTDLIDPFAAIAMGIFNVAVGGNGSCFGWSAASTRMARGAEPMTPYAPAGARTPWELAGITAPSPRLDDTIAGWHTVQLSTEFINRWITEGVSNGSLTRSAFKEKARTLIARGPVMVSLAQGGSGHAIIGYGFRDLGGDRFEIDTIDSNYPFSVEENTDTTGVTHRNRMGLSTLSFDAGRWTYTGFDPDWTGGQADVKLVGYSDWPRDPTLPIHPDSLFSILIPMGATGGELTDSRGETLAVDGSSTMDDGAVLPNLDGAGDGGFAFAVPRQGGALTYRAEPTTTASYGQGFLARGLAASVEGIEGQPGQTDIVTTDPGSGEIGVDAAGDLGDLTVELARREGGGGDGVRTAGLQLSGLGDGPVSVALSNRGGGLSATNGDQPATVTGLLGWIGPAGTPGQVELPPTALEPGDTLQVKPGDWADLGGRPTVVTVRDEDGDVRSTTRLTGDAPSADYLTGGKVSVKSKNRSSKKRTLVLKAASSALPADSHLAQLVEIRRGRTVVKRFERVVAWNGGTSTWRKQFKLRDGRYRVTAVNAVATVTGGSLVRDERQLRRKVRLR
ncbi:MAG: IPT/TIG domain-containing protein [Nocardioides sp.]